MKWFAIALFTLVGIGLIVWRRPAAHWQALAAGGRLHPGCAVAEGVLFIALAAAWYWLL